MSSFVENARKVGKKQKSFESINKVPPLRGEWKVRGSERKKRRTGKDHPKNSAAKSFDVKSIPRELPLLRGNELLL